MPQFFPFHTEKRINWSHTCRNNYNLAEKISRLSNESPNIQGESLLPFLFIFTSSGLKPVAMLDLGSILWCLQTNSVANYPGGEALLSRNILANNVTWHGCDRALRVVIVYLWQFLLHPFHTHKTIQEPSRSWAWGTGTLWCGPLHPKEVMAPQSRVPTVHKVDFCKKWTLPEEHPLVLPEEHILNLEGITHNCLLNLEGTCKSPALFRWWINKAYMQMMNTSFGKDSWAVWVGMPVETSSEGSCLPSLTWWVII